MRVQIQKKDRMRFDEIVTNINTQPVLERVMKIFAEGDMETIKKLEEWLEKHPNL